MIQRIQSFYLLLTTLLPVLFLKGRFLRFINESGSEVSFRFEGIFATNPDNTHTLVRHTLPLNGLILAIMAISFATIFLYKKRKAQLKLTVLIIILTTISIFIMLFYSWSVTNGFKEAVVPGFNLSIPLVMLLFEILAYSGIKKDEKLVSSYDRLR